MYDRSTSHWTHCTFGLQVTHTHSSTHKGPPNSCDPQCQEFRVHLNFLRKGLNRQTSPTPLTFSSRRLSFFNFGPLPPPAFFRQKSLYHRSITKCTHLANNNLPLSLSLSLSLFIPPSIRERKSKSWQHLVQSHFLPASARLKVNFPSLFHFYFLCLSLFSLFYFSSLSSAVCACFLCLTFSHDLNLSSHS